MRFNQFFSVLCLIFVIQMICSSILLSAVRFDRDNPAISLIIDRSGSMGFSNYMTPAKQRAQTFIGLMQVGDQVGVISYNETATVNFALTTITGTSTINSAQNAINNIQSSGRTSIGAGLAAGRNQLTNSTVSGQKAMILLSDGLDNYPPTAVSVVPTIPASIDVYTIALGPNSDQALLQWIANQTGGTYHYAPTPAVLQQIYNTISGMLRGYQNYLSGHDIIGAQETRYYSVNIDNADFVFFSVASNEEYSDQLSALELSLINPYGQEIHKNNCLNNDLAEGFSYKSYHISQPISGEWLIKIDNHSFSQNLEYDISVYGLSHLMMQHILPTNAMLVDDPLVLIVELTDNGNPVSNAAVTATVRYPDSNEMTTYSNSFPFEDETANDNDYVITRTSTELELILSETEPGRYETLFYDTSQSGSYIVEFSSLINYNNILISRNLLATYYLTTSEPVAAPILLQPENNLQNLITEVNFLWTPVLNADSYQIQIANDQEILFDINQIGENTITLTLPNYNTEYMWRVRALAGEEEGIWSNIFSFATGIPDVPIPINLQGYIQNNSISLYWEHPETEDFHGDPWFYKIFRNDSYYDYVMGSEDYYLDEHIYSDQPYSYHVTAFHHNGFESLPSNTITIDFVSIDLIGEISPVTGINYNYPNPFNPETNIVFSLAEPYKVKVDIYDIAGRLVKNLVDEYLDKGEHIVSWSGVDNENKSVTSGVYFVKMQTTGYIGHKKILLLK
ncbi:MAG: VWA domain-containing protein [Candidatus Cloacimonetes bacterium]|nr:VWA domain-containing protein [Candidatus Cloacimonadota bacterium]